MKRSNFDSPEKRLKKYRWISVDSSEILTTHSPPSHKPAKKSEDLHTENFLETEVPYDLTPQAHISKDYTFSSVAPKSSRFLKKNASKRYNCPYYIKPERWNRYNKAPEFNEFTESDRIVNFYYHMHEPSVNPNPFSDQAAPVIPVSKKRFDQLPPIQKYKE